MAVRLRDRALGWLVTGAPARLLAFVVDLAEVAWILRQRRKRPGHS